MSILRLVRKLALLAMLAVAAHSLTARVPTTQSPEFCWRPPCQYSGYCEVWLNNGMLLLSGNCVSHRYPGCYIQGSKNCPSGAKAIRVSLTSCGGLGQDRIDLARQCSF